MRLRDSALVLLLLVACEPQAPSGPDGPTDGSDTGSTTGSGPTETAPQGILVCQGAVDQGVGLVELAVELVTGGTGSDPKDAIPKFRETQFECFKYLANRQPGEPPLKGVYEAQMAVCLSTANASSEASSYMVALALGKGDVEKLRAGGLGALAAARRLWPLCFPGEPLPQALEPPDLGP